MEEVGFFFIVSSLYRKGKYETDVRQVIFKCPLASYRQQGR
ncbi:hypothetical protein C1A50_1657 [Paenibacillus polymyxa]|nr:hypothetical protein C1A50_1657 [Paenibacillus polymyxa]